MDENEEICEKCEPVTPEIVVRPQGAPTEVVVFLIVLLAALCALAWFTRNDALKPCDTQTIAVSQAQKAQMDYQTACQKRVTDVQLAVLKACVEKGNIPVIFNGNVDCKLAPK